MAECSGIVGKVNAGLKEGLKYRKKRVSQILQIEKSDTITACCIEWVRTNFIILEISSSEIQTGQGISGGYKALEILER